MTPFWTTQPISIRMSPDRWTRSMGFYFRGSHYGMEDVPVADYGDISTRPDVRYVVDSTLYPTVGGLDGVMRERSLSAVKHIGAFVVYENPGYNGA